MWRNALLIVSCMLISDWANVLLKLGSAQEGFDLSFGKIRGLLTNPYLVSGVLLYGTGMLLWLAVLAQNRFSTVVILFSVHYLHLMLLSRLVFKEPITWNMWAGAIFVMLGVGLFSAGGLPLKRP